VKLSVVTVVKDDPAGLAATVDSLEDQTGGVAIEHVIVDGSSKPLARELSTSGSYVHRTVIAEAARGVYPAMNRGLAQVTGEYVWFVNAGDTLADASTVA
jgi:glycosyltransferase involved in cell wall biosynthesis